MLHGSIKLFLKSTVSFTKQPALDCKAGC